MLYSIPPAVVLPTAPILFALSAVLFACVIIYGVARYLRGM